MHLSTGRWYASAFMFSFSELEGIPLLMEIIGERCILMNVRPAAEQEQQDHSEQTPTQGLPTVHMKGRRARDRWKQPMKA